MHASNEECKAEREESKNSRHRLWKAMNHKVGIEWLHYVLAHQTMVDAGVLVLLQRRQVVRADVNHGGQPVWGMDASRRCERTELKSALRALKVRT